MTENNHYPSQPPLVTSPYMAVPTPPAPKKQAWWKKPIVFIPAAALLMGLGMGAAVSPEPETVEVIKEVQVPGPERIVTKNVEVPTTPASCLTYIDLSEQAFDYASSAMGAVSERNLAALDGYTKDLQAIAPKVNAAKAQCRAS